MSAAVEISENPSGMANGKRRLFALFGNHSKPDTGSAVDEFARQANPVWLRVGEWHRILSMVAREHATRRRQSFPWITH